MPEGLDNCRAVPPKASRSNSKGVKTAYHSEGDVRLYKRASILPTIEELKEERPFLKPNIVEGPYEDVDEYLGTQFGLLREDFVAPLRIGYQLFRQLYFTRNLSRHSLSKIEGVHFYIDVKLDKSTAARRLPMAVTVLKLAWPDWNSIDWSQSNRLKSGSLVALSDNFFGNIEFAVVSHYQTTSFLSRGTLLVELLNESAKYKRSNTFILMENSSAYFEAYRHNLKVIQKVVSHHFPLNKYIAGGQSAVQPPSFIKPHQQFDFSPILKQDLLPVGKSSDWPSESETILNKQQFLAVESAFKRELCLIQGPPGTGKTFVALRIVEMLLLNNVTKAPLLVVCYTNHALDQFLEGILRFTNDIVRVGGSSKSDKLKEFTLNELMKGSPEVRKALETLALQREECEERLSQLNGTNILSQEEVFNNEVDLEKFLGLDPPPSTRAERSAATATSAKPRRDANFLRDQDRGQVQEQTDFSLSDRVLENSSSKFRRTLIKNKLGEPMRNRLPKAQLNRLRRDIKNQRLTLNEQWMIYRHEHWRYLERWASDYIQKCSTLTANTGIYISQRLESSLPRNNNIIRHVIDCLHFRIAEIEDSISSLQEANYKLRRKSVILSSKRVIGMTTTGAAKYNNLIQSVKPEIVIVEEAAEVLEAHLIASLVPSTKQLILIGDHQQLQPITAVHRLAVDFGMEISLFERLVRNKVDFVKLEEQHRMRDEFLCLLVPHIYRDYFSHNDVNSYPDVRGITSNMFFMKHSFEEQVDPEAHSKSNTFEAQMVVRLAYLFRQQGYEASEITILATYRGQVAAIEADVSDFCAKRNFTEMHDVEVVTRTALGKKKPVTQRIPKNAGLPLSPFEGMRITTVDNYQGEENQIVIVSLVRSNNTTSIGFLSKDNRVCVAMSRAKHGLYCIGNIPVLAKASPTWTQIKAALEEREKLGDGFELVCEKHNIRKVAQCPEDFDEWSTKRCGKICGTSLSCGHLCHRICHKEDEAHEAAYSCDSICKKVHPCGHLCFKLCRQPCGTCVALTSKQLECGHRVTGRCCDELKCWTEIVHKPKCGHEFLVHCCAKNNADLLCGKPVSLSRPCGHTLRASCDAKIVDKPCPTCLTKANFRRNRRNNR